VLEGSAQRALLSEATNHVLGVVLLYGVRHLSLVPPRRSLHLDMVRPS